MNNSNKHIFKQDKSSSTANDCYTTSIIMTIKVLIKQKECKNMQRTNNITAKIKNKAYKL